MFILDSLMKNLSSHFKLYYIIHILKKPINTEFSFIVHNNNGHHIYKPLTYLLRGAESFLRR